MFHGEIMIEVERRVIARLDERAKAGLPAVSLDGLRAIVRADLMKEIEDKRQASRRPVSPSAPPARLAPVPPRPAAAAVKPREIGGAMLQRLMEEDRARDARRPVPVAPKKEATPAQSSAEIAANAILEATRLARSCS